MRTMLSVYFLSTIVGLSILGIWRLHALYTHSLIEHILLVKHMYLLSASFLTAMRALKVIVSRYKGYV